MTREELKSRWGIMQAFTDGNKVERRVPYGEWIEIEDATDICDADYEVRLRVEPAKPRKHREIWVDEYPSGLGPRFYSTKYESNGLGELGLIRRVKFVEVLE